MADARNVADFTPSTDTRPPVLRPVHRPVQLAEVDFLRLTTISQQYHIAELEAKARLARAEAARRDYLHHLKTVYPDFDPNFNYSANDKTFVLTPIVAKEGEG